MRKLGLLIWPLAALIGAVSIMVAAPTHTSPLVQNGASTSLLPS